MSEEKILGLKPEFSAKKNLFLNSLIWLPISIAAGLESAILYFTFAGDQVPAVISISILTAVVTFLILIVLAFLNEKLNCKATDYSVYKNRVEYNEGFIDSQHVMVLLADVREVHLRRSFLQKKCGLGTIRFVTGANTSRTAVNGLHSTGINFKDIKNSCETFAEITKLLEAKK